jgi:hypothetical protein
MELYKAMPTNDLGYTLADYSPVYEMPKEW